MYLNLNDYQFKSSRYNYWSSYMNPMVTTNQKLIRDTQKLKRKETKHTTKEKPSDLNGTKKKKKKEYTEKNDKNNQKPSCKMAIRTSLPIITISASGLNALIKRHRVADWINE